jgi:hypothetical protein
MTAKRAPRKRKESVEITKEFVDAYNKNFNCSNIQLKKMFPLTDTQTQFYYQSQYNNTNMMFVDGPAGSAKAQPLSEPIPTPTGWKTMGDIKIGDEVFSADGTPTKVLGVFPQGKKTIFKIEFSDGTSTRCCGDHLWNTSSYNDRNRWTSKRSNGKRIKISKLEPIFKTNTTNEIRLSLYHNGRINHMIPIISSPIVYKQSNLPIDPYVMGLLLGDGCFRTTPIRISSGDQEIVDFLTEKYQDNFKHLKQYDYRIKNLTNHIQDMGLYELYSHEKFIPSIYKISSVDDRISILQGLLDSDGSATKKGSVTYSITSKQLALDVIEIVNSLGGIAHMTERLGILNGVEHKIYYNLYINLPKEIIPFKLTRKLNRYVPNVKYSPKRYIKDIIEIGEEECQCILIDKDDHLYLTKNYIVTHNTYISVYSALELLKDRHVDQIIYIRSVVESSSRSIGALPGELEDKFGPYSMPLVDKLNEILDKSTIKSLMDEEYIKAIPVNFVRGLTFNRSVVIIDEAQNMNRSELTTILTRFGRDTKYIVCGDAKQSDIKDSGFTKVFELFDTEFSRKNNIHCMKFDTSDINRSQILKHITQILSV